MKRMRRKLSWICLALVLLYTFAPVALAADNHEKALQSVVRLYTEATLETYINGELYASSIRPCKGSGFAIGKKGESVTTFVTNRHVVKPDVYDLLDFEYEPQPGNYVDQDGNVVSVRYMISDISNYIVLDDIDTKKQVARTIVSDKYDLACVIIASPVSDRTPASIGLYNTLGRQDVWAMGFPGLSDVVIEGGYGWKSMPSTLDYCTITQGLSQMTVQNDSLGNVVQHTAEISPGNSGGPLVDKNGYVVGVNTWGFTSEAVQANVAQTTAQLKQFLDSENILAEYVNIGGLPITTIAIVAAAVILVGAIIAFGILSGKKPGNKVKVLDPQGVRSLVVASGALKVGSSFSLVPGKIFLIGTDSTKCNLVYPRGTPGVSRVHCSVIFDGKTVTIKDENSSYGVFIDDMKIEKNKPTVMHRGHALGLGSKRESLKLR